MPSASFLKVLLPYCCCISDSHTIATGWGAKGQFRADCAGLPILQLHFASQPHRYQAGVVELLPHGKQSVHVGGGRQVAMHLEIDRLSARCLLPFEKSNSTASPGQHVKRKFQKATVNFTVNVRFSFCHLPSGAPDRGHVGCACSSWVVHKASFHVFGCKTRSAESVPRDTHRWAAFVGVRQWHGVRAGRHPPPRGEATHCVAGVAHLLIQVCVSAC